MKRTSIALIYCSILIVIILLFGDKGTLFVLIVLPATSIGLSIATIIKNNRNNEED